MIKKRGNILNLTGKPTKENLLKAFIEMYRVAVCQLPSDVGKELKLELST